MGLPRARSVQVIERCRACLGDDLVGEGTTVRCHDCGERYVLRLVPARLSAQVERWVADRMRALRLLGRTRR